jgi:CRISPR-associated endonuclease Cas1
MTASHTLARSPILEQIPKHGILFMAGFGLRLQVKSGHLNAEWGIGEERHRLCLPRVARNLRRVIVVSSDGFATFDAIRWISDIGASLVFLDRRGKLLFASTPTASSDVRTRRAQSLALENGTALKICRELISQKLDGQAAIVRDMLGSSAAADAILRFKAKLTETDNIDAVRLLEAQAAKMYWSQWADVPIRWPLKDEHRVAAHWKFFGSRISPLTRSPRLAANPPNACMNLIHALCESECRIALIGMGLDPEIGLLHCDAPNRSSLANDLQEILRPRVDSFVLNWIQTEHFRKADFWEDRYGNCRIASRLARRLCETADTWRKLVAPVAEYVAQALWSSVSKPASSSKLAQRLIATRLTQRNKREVKGSNVPEVKHPKPEHVCSGCGKGIQDRSGQCADCAIDGATQRLSNASLIGRVAARSPEARTKHIASRKRHAEAISAWEESMQPAWLTSEFFSRQIQPKLANIATSVIRSSIGVSRWYAGRIREGYRPHPRHWLALAKLVSVSANG